MDDDIMRFLFYKSKVLTLTIFSKFNPFRFLSNVYKSVGNKKEKKGKLKISETNYIVDSSQRFMAD